MKRFSLLLLLPLLIATTLPSNKEGKDKKAPPPPLPTFELQGTIRIEPQAAPATLVTSNGCGLGNLMIPSTGDPAQGLPPTVSGLMGNTGVIVLDTIPGSYIRGVAFERESWPQNSSVIKTEYAPTPYVVISDTGLFAYQFPAQFGIYFEDFNRVESVIVPNILQVAKEITEVRNDPIVVLTNPSPGNYELKHFAYPALLETVSVPFPFEPEIFEVSGSNLYLTGQDTSGNHVLHHRSSQTDTLYRIYPLNDSASHAHEIIRSGDTIYLLSTPGDSITLLSKLCLTDSSLLQSVVYPSSGARATHNEYLGDRLFTFQPLSDTSSAELHRQILVLNPMMGSLDTFSVNLELDYFKHPKPVSQAFGLIGMDWLGAKWNGGTNDTVYHHHYTTNPKPSQGFPQWINATYSCFPSVNENELDKIKFESYPNPAVEAINVTLSGLKKGRHYQLDIVDASGKVHHTTHLQAYQRLELPVHQLATGIYFLKLNTGKNIISKKMVIQ